MRSLYLRIYVTVLVVLLLFSVVGGLIVHEQMERRASEVRQRVENRFHQRSAAWAELIEESLPEGTEPKDVQISAVRAWSQRLGLPLALDDGKGQRIVTAGHPQDMPVRWLAFDLRDHRTLWLGLRPGPKSSLAGSAQPSDAALRAGHSPAPLLPTGLIPGLDSTLNLLVMLFALFVAVALGAWPAVRSLTRRLVDLNEGVQHFGQGDLSVRVPVRGRDEVAALAVSFNQAAQKVQDLVQAHQSLLANASHELRSPLARLKMALAMLPGADTEQQSQLSHEINTDIAELDALVEEVLLSSRIEAGAVPVHPEPVALDGLLDAVLERAGLGPAQLEIVPPLSGRSQVLAHERLLERAVRNLVENAQRYGGSDVQVRISAGIDPAAQGLGQICIDVLDRGPGVAPELRERIFEAFYRLPGHAEHAGGVGLGLSLVRQIAQRQNAQAQCLPRDDGPGSCFRLIWPRAPDQG